MPDEFGQPRPAPFQAEPSQSQFNVGMTGAATGIPALDMILQLLLGQNFAPRPLPGSAQSIYDAHIMRERSQEFLKVSNQALIMNQVVARLGQPMVNSLGAGVLSFANMATGGLAEGGVAQMLTPFLGGNPVLARQRLYAGMSGGMALGAFGQTMGEISAGQVDRMYSILEQRMFQGGKRIDWGSTYGVRTEDVMQSFIQASNMGLLGRAGRGPEGMMNAFKGFLGTGTKGGIGWLDAARTVLGGENINETMGLLDQFLGRSTVDLKTEVGQTRVEDTLRSVKAAARVAGVSIEAIKGIIQEGQALAAAHPGLQGLGGLDIANMGPQAINAAARAAATMPSHLLRAMGGTVGVAQAEMRGRLQSAAEPITQRLYGLYGYFGAGAAGTAIMNFAKGGNITQESYRAFVGDLSKTTGMTQMDLASIAGTESFAANGQALQAELKDGDQISQAGRSAAMAIFEREIRWGGGDINAWRAAISEGKDPTEAARRSGARNYRNIGRLTAWGLKNNLFDYMRREYDPTYRKEAEAQDTAVAQIAVSEKTMARNLAKLRVPMGWEFLQKMMGGDFGREGIIGGLQNMFGEGEETKTLNDMIMKIRDMGDNMTTGNVVAAINAVGGPEVKATEEEVNALTGLTDKFSVQEIYDLGGISTEAGINSRLKAQGKKELSPSEIANLKKARGFLGRVGYARAEVRRAFSGVRNLADVGEAVKSLLPYKAIDLMGKETLEKARDQAATELQRAGITEDPEKLAAAWEGQGAEAESLQKKYGDLRTKYRSFGSYLGARREVEETRQARRKEADTEAGQKKMLELIDLVVKKIGDMIGVVTTLDKTIHTEANK